MKTNKIETGYWLRRLIPDVISRRCLQDSLWRRRRNQPSSRRSSTLTSENKTTESKPIVKTIEKYFYFYFCAKGSSSRYRLNEFEGRVVAETAAKTILWKRQVFCYCQGYVYQIEFSFALYGRVVSLAVLLWVGVGVDFIVSDGVIFFLPPTVVCSVETFCVLPTLSLLFCIVIVRFSDFASFVAARRSCWLHVRLHESGWRRDFRSTYM